MAALEVRGPLLGAKLYDDSTLITKKAVGVFTRPTVINTLKLHVERDELANPTARSLEQTFQQHKPAGKL